MNDNIITVGSLSREMESALSPKYGSGEAKAMTRLIFHHLKGWNLTDLVIHSDNPVSEYLQSKIDSILSRLGTNEPLQYILGEAYFYGMNLKVTPATLIPRPETAEFVDLIIDNNRDKKDLRILDIGTGSGAIAIALARHLPFADVSAIDISTEAISVAKQNASALKTKIDFEVRDIFTDSPADRDFDIIVSNPPYIDDSEKADMESNVLDFEPHEALFVPDSDPLIFYKRIIELARTLLSRCGQLYFEINPRHADELANILNCHNFSEIQIHKDMYGKQRFITCLKPC